VTNPRTILFRVAIDASNPPVLELGAGTELSLTVTDANWNSVSTASPYAAPLWKAREWVHIRAVWNNTAETDSLQIYVNGEQVNQKRIAGNWSFGADTAELKLHLGQADGVHIAHGIIDEFFIRR
jgi:Concanavalin A-like lectin/glucanases superfamily